MPKHTLDSLITEYLKYREKDVAENTLLNNARCLRHLLAHVGNVQILALTPLKMDGYIAARKGKVSNATLNVEMTTFRGFFAYCRSRGFAPVTWDPMVGRKQVSDRTKRKRVTVPPERFGELLEAAGRNHPRDRMAVACGLYLFTRQGEVSTLKLGDINLDASEITVTIHKHKEGDWRDRMGYGVEFDRELRAYLSWYTSAVGELDTDMYLVPCRKPPGFAYTEDGRREFVTDEMGIRPFNKYSQVYKCAQGALKALGYNIDYEGGHTLRRSGATALFRQLRDDQGYDYALQTVSLRLHHALQTTTEKYLEVGADRDRANQYFKGRMMFPPKTSTAPGVVDLSSKIPNREAM